MYSYMFTLNLMYSFKLNLKSTVLLIYFNQFTSYFICTESVLCLLLFFFYSIFWISCGIYFMLSCYVMSCCDVLQCTLYTLCYYVMSCCNLWWCYAVYIICFTLLCYVICHVVMCGSVLQCTTATIHAQNTNDLLFYSTMGVRCLFLSIVILCAEHSSRPHDRKVIFPSHWTKTQWNL